MRVGEVGGSSQITETEQGSSVRRGDMVFTADGKFAPGNRSGGRKPKAVEKAYLDAMQAAMPPEKIEALLGEALELARSTRSWRGIVEVITLAMAYGAGKPVSKTVHTDGNLDALLAALQDDKPLLPASASAELNTRSNVLSIQAAAGVVARLDVRHDDGGAVVDVVPGEIVSE